MLIYTALSLSLASTKSWITFTCCHRFFSQLLMIFLVSFKIKAYLCSYYKTDMEQVEESYIFIFTPIHTKMTFMDVANTIIK